MPRKRHGSRRGSAVALLALSLLIPSRSPAVDGRLEARSNVQSGQAGTENYRQETLRTEAAANQRISLGPFLMLRGDGRLLREEFSSRFDTVETDLTRRAEEGRAALDFVSRRIRLGLHGGTFTQRNSGTGIDARRLERRQAGMSGNFRNRRLRLSTSGLFTAARREVPSGPASRSQEWVGSAGLRYKIPLGEVGYRYSVLEARNLTLETRSAQFTHSLTYNGSVRFADGRALAGLRTNSNFFTQDVSRSRESVAERLRLPQDGGVVLDDTPAVLDPLEGEVTSVPALDDRDRAAPTSINVGDSAPMVREFGGDYRNIQYDFGEAVDLSSAILYVDQTLLAPGLFRWRVFTSNDPLGRTWEEVAPGAVAVDYREWGTGLQGWSVTFAQPISARFFKMVDEKLGPTVPDLFVTELEVYVREGEATEEKDHSSTNNHRVAASLGYAFTPELNGGYDLSYRRRTFSDRSSLLEDVTHALSAGWTRSIWSLSGRYTTRRLEGRRSGDTSYESQHLGVQRGRAGALLMDLSWTRAHDHGEELGRTSNAVALGATWPALPALRFRSQVSAGRLRDREVGQTSSSLVVTSAASGSPIPNLSIDLEWTDRWVSQEAGAGYSRFRDSSATLAWRPVPLVSLESQVRYEARSKGEWLTRNTVSWTPLSAGTFRTRLSASHYHDTRADETQRSGGGQIEWDATPNLSFQGSLESLALTTRGQQNSPTNAAARGTLRF